VTQVHTRWQRTPQVAVVVPCYNIEAYLERALQSIFAQTYRDYCIYAVDDESTDGTALVLEKYADQCVRLSRPHGGLAAARNTGVRNSQSPFIAFLDGDDEWLPRMLERQVGFLKHYPGVGLVCSHWVCREIDGAQDSRRLVGCPAGNGRLFERLARDCFVNASTVVVRRECLEQAGPFDESLAVSEDYNMWLRIASRWKIALQPEVLAITYKRPGSLSLGTATELRLRTGIDALEGAKSGCAGLSARETRALNAGIAERNYFYGSYLLSTGATATAREKLARALQLNPFHWRAVAKLSLSFLPPGAFRSFAQLKTKRPFRLRRPGPARV
jgi:glycosyltransferase involved in cell wall biosynthesis